MTSPARRLVVGVGAANVDVHGRSRRSIVMRDSNPGHLATSVGGVTRNILENLARQGLPATLLSAVGGDVYGEIILRESARAGIDVSHVRVDAEKTSSCYIAMLDERGDMLLGMSDMRIVENLEPDYLEENREIVRSAAAVVCDASLPTALLSRLLDVAKEAGTPVLIDPVSTAYARKMEPLAGRFDAIKPNEMELAVLSGLPTDSETEIERACEALLLRGTRRVAVSRGEKGCYYADRTGRRVFRMLKPVESMVNATGAGDAFMAGFTHGVVAGMPLDETLDYALASGITAIQSLATIHPGMSDALVRENLARYRIVQP